MGGCVWVTYRYTTPFYIGVLSILEWGGFLEPICRSWGMTVFCIFWYSVLILCFSLLDMASFSSLNIYNSSFKSCLVGLSFGLPLDSFYWLLFVLCPYFFVCLHISNIWLKTGHFSKMESKIFPLDFDYYLL